MFKKIYIEITNKCNLNCSFCSKSKRDIKELSVKEFEHIIKEINDYTNYVYLHVKGEPLLHNNIDDILGICRKYNKKVNITTNGTLLKDKLSIILKNKDIIRQINISMHALVNNYNYLDNVIDTVINILNNSNIIISLRLWNIHNNIDTNDEVYKYLVKKFNLEEENIHEFKNKYQIKIMNNLYLNKDRVFIWPSLDNDYYNEIGKCYGTISHVGILSDGRVIPCCLDSEAIINLGNIFDNSFKDIINSELFKEINRGFRNNKKICELCRRCSFLDK